MWAGPTGGAVKACVYLNLRSKGNYLLICNVQPGPVTRSGGFEVWIDDADAVYDGGNGC